MKKLLSIIFLSIVWCGLTETVSLDFNDDMKRIIQILAHLKTTASDIAKRQPPGRVQFNFDILLADIERIEAGILAYSEEPLLEIDPIEGDYLVWTGGRMHEY
jgi:hypothetical protein